MCPIRVNFPKAVVDCLIAVFFPIAAPRERIFERKTRRSAITAATVVESNTFLQSANGKSNAESTVMRSPLFAGSRESVMLMLFHSA